MEYSYSLDEGLYHGAFDSPEEAAFAGLRERLMEYPEDENPIISVGENCPPCMGCPVDADDVLDALVNTEDFGGEWAGNFEPSKAEKEDLTRRIAAAWDEWLKENQIEPGFYNVQNQKEWTMEFHTPFTGPECDLRQCGVVKLCCSPQAAGN